eukprot:g75625.t1
MSNETDKLISISSGAIYEQQVHDVPRPKSQRRLNVVLLLFAALAALVMVMTHRVGGQGNMTNRVGRQVSPASAAQSTVTQPVFEVANKAKGGKGPKAEGGKAKGDMKKAKGSTTTTLPAATTTTTLPAATTATAC